MQGINYIICGCMLIFISTHIIFHCAICFRRCVHFLHGEMCIDCIMSICTMYESA